MRMDVEKIVEKIEDELEKATLAAQILNDLDPNLDNLTEFIDTLDENTREELYARLAERS